MIGLMWRSVDHPGKLIFSPDLCLSRYTQVSPAYIEDRKRDYIKTSPLSDQIEKVSQMKATALSYIAFTLGVFKIK